MGIFDKMKESLKEVEDFGKKIGIDTDKMQIGKGSDAAKSPPPSETPSAAPSAAPTASTAPTSSSYAGTPNTSVAPSEAPGAPKKLPLTVRKSVRDDFETPKPQLEEKLSKILGAKWSIFVDVPNVYSYSHESTDYAKQNPGKMYTDYFESAMRRLEEAIRQHGQDLCTSINRLAPAHLMTLEPDKNIKYCGSDISNGKLRILFNPTGQGVNIPSAFEYIGDVVSKAGASEEAGAGAGSGPALNLAARSGIRNDYDPKMGNVETESRRLLKCPTLTFVPNFEANYAKVRTYVDTLDREDKSWPLDDKCDESLGRLTVQYFEGFLSWVQNKNFRKDEMMQEAFKDAVEKNEVELRVVDDLPGYPGNSRNDCIIEEGRFVIRSKLTSWGSNTMNASERIADLL